MCSITNSSTNSILDTLLFDGQKIKFKYLHALRTFEAYQFLNRNINLEKVLLIYNDIEKEIFSLESSAKTIRIVFNSQEVSLKYTILPLDPLPNPIILQLITNPRQDSGLAKNNFKWEDRTFWANLHALKKENVFDLLTINENNHIVESSRFNIFCYDNSAKIVHTPPLASGCINGVYRRFVMNEGFINLPHWGRTEIKEYSILANDLSKYQLFVANSVRGVLPAELL